MSVTPSVEALSVASLVRIGPGGVDDPEGLEPLGTCFPFRRRTHFLTASHCVEDKKAEDLSVKGVYYGKKLVRASEVLVHPVADLAVVVFDEPPDIVGASFGHAYPFMGIDNAGAMGIDVTVYGYPFDSRGITADKALPRMMKGHIQRIVNTDRFSRSKPPVSLGGMELSVFTDVGFSGAPVFRPAKPSLVAAMVTSSNQSYVGAETEEEYVTDTSYSRTVYRDVVSFGLALILPPFSGWIDEVIPQQGEN